MRRKKSTECPTRAIGCGRNETAITIANNPNRRRLNRPKAFRGIRISGSLLAIEAIANAITTGAANTTEELG